MSETASITWNPDLRLAVSDVDETIAEVYAPAESKMIAELSSFLSQGGKLFMVTGGSLKRAMNDIIKHIDPKLRSSILVSHCSGAEVWGFTKDGTLRSKPFYSLYEGVFDDDMKRKWRQVIDQLVKEFSLRPHPAQPKVDFWESVGRDPRDIMLDDRGPQITMEIVNGNDLSNEQASLFRQTVPPAYDGRLDIRIPISQRARGLFAEMKVPVTPRLAGTFALDFAIEGSSKTSSIKYVLENPEALTTIGLTAGDLVNPRHIEIWGDKYSVINGGTDRHMSEAFPPSVRSIDFREEDPSELPDGYNIVIWDGRHHLHHGLAEYLESRHA